MTLSIDCPVTKMPCLRQLCRVERRCDRKSPDDDDDDGRPNRRPSTPPDKPKVGEPL